MDTHAARCLLASVLLFTADGLARADEPAPPAPAVVEPAAPAPVVAEPAAPVPRAQVVENDVTSSLVVAQAGGASVALGALVQLHLAPYVGADSLLDNHDPASRAGFLLRRARFGVAATLPSDLRLVLVLNPLASDRETGTISEATVAWAPRPWLRITAGADKVPYTRGELTSSARLAAIDRPLAVQLFVPQRRLGTTVDGALAGGALTYVAGVLNATEGTDRGNQFGGLLYVARLQGRLAPAAPGGFGLAAGVGGLLEDGSATTTLGGSVDVQAQLGGAALLLEGLCQRLTPVDSPATAPTVADRLTRCGAYAEGAYRDVAAFETVVRLEWVDDNLDVDDAGDALLVTAGLNRRLGEHLRAQAFYLHRTELHGVERSNDALIFSLQGEL